MPLLRRPTLDENNRWYTAVMVGGGGVAGSLVSFLYSAGLVLGLWRLALGLIALPRDPAVRLIGAAFAAHFAAETLSTLVNYREAWNLAEGIVVNIPFLAFLIIFGRLSLTARADVLRSVEYGAVAGAYGAGVFALVEIFIVGVARAEGMAGNAGPFALVCTILYGFCVAIAIYRHDRMRKVAAAAALFAAIGVILSGMRSLWPLLILLPPLLVWLLGFAPRLRVNAKSLLAGLAIALVVAGLAYGTVKTRVLNMVADVEGVAEGDYDNSLGERLRVWGAAIELIDRQPVFGLGPANVRAGLKEAMQEEGERAISFSHAHNLALNALLRSGILGLAAVIAMLVAPLWLAGRAKKDEIGRIGYALMVMACATYLVNGAVNVSFGHDIMDAFYLYCMIVSAYMVFGPSGLPRYVLLENGRRVAVDQAAAAG